MIVYIYALLDPDTNEVRYVGKTTNMKMRNTQHFSTCLKGTDKKSKWIASLREQGKRPKMIPLEECAIDTWVEAEKRWIAHYRLSSKSLTNVSSGGNGAPLPTQKYPSKIAPLGLPDDTREMLTRMIKITGRSQADIVREAVDKYLDQFFEPGEVS